MGRNLQLCDEEKVGAGGDARRLAEVSKKHIIHI
jgi:hypothetical protein